jgi:hypothetical protein
MTPVKRYALIFMSAFSQIVCVAFQTWQIAHISELSHGMLRIFAVSAMVSATWLVNVNLGIKDCYLTKTFYLLGCSFGAVVGTYAGVWVGGL